MKKKKLLLFLAKLVVGTLVLGYLWFEELRIEYVDLLTPVAEPFLMLLGASKWWLAMVLEHFTSLVPYIALVMASPGLISRWKSSLVGLAAGVAIIVTGHLFMSAAIYHIMDNFGMSRTAYVFLMPVYIFNDALPLVLWLVFFPGILTDLTGIAWTRKAVRTVSRAKGA